MLRGIRHIILLLTLLLSGMLNYAYGFGYTGSCSSTSNNVSYSWYSETGVLDIHGTGAMWDFSTTDKPGWQYNSGPQYITSVYVQSGVTRIGNYSFYNMPNLTEVIIASSVTSIGTYALHTCPKLTDIHVSWTGTIPTWPSNMTNKTASTIRLHVPCGTKSKYQAAAGWKNYKIVEEASGGSFGTEGANVMWSLSCDHKTLTFTGSGAMAACSASSAPWKDYRTEITKVVIGSGITNIGECVCYGMTNLASVTIPVSVTSIGSGAFINCSSLASITLPSALTTIESEAFYGCSSLTAVTFPNTLTTLGFQAFAQCSSLASVKILKSITTWATSTFRDCSGLTSVTIENGITIIPTNTFMRCTSLTSVSMPNSVTEIQANAFDGCSSLQNITLSTKLVSINQLAFRDCSALTAISIPNTVTGIGNSAFLNCSSLTSVKLSNKLTALPTSIFKGCSSLPSITIPSSVTVIGLYAFQDCSSLTSVTLPNTLTSIQSGAFNGCSSLPSVTIPKSVTTLGSYAFYNCGSLKDIYVSWTETPPTWTNLTNNVSKSVTLHIPCGCGSLYRSENGWKYYTIRGDTDGYSLTVQSNNAEGGQVSIDDGAAAGNVNITSYCASEHTITATPTCLYHFVQWNDGNTTNPRTVYLDSPASSYTAEFAINQGFCGANGDNLIWSLDNCSHILTISGSGAMADYSGSNSPWYKSRTDIWKIVLPDGLTTIGNFAFSGCAQVRSINIPNTVTSIGTRAFSNCNELKTVDLPESVETIGNYVFYCSGTSVGITDIYVHWTAAENIPDCPASVHNRSKSNVKLHVPCGSAALYTGYWASKFTIPAEDVNGTFGEDGDNLTWEYHCSDSTLRISGTGSMGSGRPWTSFRDGIKHVIIDNGVTTISNGAFYDGYNNLQTVIIPASVTQMNSTAFLRCYSLESMVVDAGNPKYDSRNNCNAIIETATNTLLFGCKNTIIPNTVTAINQFAFEYCHYLTSISIPPSVTTIGIGVFKQCENLTDIYLHWTTDANIILCPNIYTFESTYSTPYPLPTVHVHVPCGTTALYEAKSWNKYGNFVIVDDAPINSGACGAVGNENEVLWSFSCDSVLTISGTGAMADWTAYTTMPWNAYKNIIKTVIIEDGVTNIGNNSFIWCTKLSSVTIPESVTVIGQRAFCGCTSLTSVDIPSHVESIGKNAFENNPITSIRLPETLSTMGQYIFSNCNNLADIYVAWTEAIPAYPTFRGDITGITLHVPCGTTSLYQAADGWKNFTTVADVPNIKSGTYGPDNIEWSLDYCDSTLSITGNGELRCDNNTWGPNAGGINPNAVKRVFIGKGVTYLGIYTLSYMSNIEYIEVEDGHPTHRTGCNAIIRIGTEQEGDTLIFGCPHTVIPTTCTTIRGYAFWDDHLVTEMTIPSSVKQIANMQGSLWQGNNGQVFYTSNNAGEGLKDLYVEWTTLEDIPVVPNNRLGDMTKVRLHVPCGTTALYKQVTGWKNFKEYIEETASYTITVTTDDASMGMVQLGTAAEQTSFTEQFNCGEEITITAIPANGYAFDQWSDNSTQASRTITITSDTTLTALFKQSAYPVEHGALPGVFSVSNTKKVVFSQGNLQFNAALGTHQRAGGTTANGTWRFAENQYDFVGDNTQGNVYCNDEKCSNERVSNSYNGWIDYFNHGNTGYSDKSPTSYTTAYGMNINSPSVYDWGSYVAISNGGNMPGYIVNGWIVLQRFQWYYLFNSRANAQDLRSLATVNDVLGCILLPDDWELPSGLVFTPDISSYETNTFTKEQWTRLEQAGAVFLPAAGRRVYDSNESPQLSYPDIQTAGYVWSSSSIGNQGAAVAMSFGIDNFALKTFYQGRNYDGLSVRLVHYVSSYHVIFRGYKDGEENVVLQDKLVAEGAMPIPPEVPEDDCRTFIGWDRVIEPASGDTEYIAQYELKGPYTVTVQTATGDTSQGSVSITVP